MCRLIAVVVLAALGSVAVAWTPPLYNSTVWEAFRAKVLLNPPGPLPTNPYTVPGYNTTWVPTVCAVKYPTPGNRSHYLLRNYPTRPLAEADGAFVTHEHPCGACSTTADLSVYMQYPDLTNPVRSCALLLVLDDVEGATKCLQRVGFTRPCSQIWLYDANNTRQECLKPCITALVEHTPNNVPPNSTVLNPCLQCDEDRSGPIFKVAAGRTRRDSGLRSTINRPASSVYHVVHNYY